MNGNQILCECHADTFAIGRILRLKYVNHQRNIQKVLQAFERNFRDRLAVGVVDNDKKAPSELKLFTPIYEHPTLSLHRKPDTRHFLIILTPAIEGFLIDAATKAELDLARYKMETLKKMKMITKSAQAPQRRELLALVNDLRRANPEPISHLTSFFEEIPKL